MAKKSTSPKATAAKTKVTTTKTKKAGLLDNTPLVGMGIAEFVGTFLLVGSIFAVQGQPLFVAFALIGLVLILGGISGAHLNPAITVGALATKKIKSKTAAAYIVAQVLGALLAFALFSSMLGATTPAQEAETVYSNGQTLLHVVDIEGSEAATKGKEWVLFAAETLGVFALSFGVASALRQDKKQKIVAGTTVGLALLIGLLLASSITSTLLVENNTTLTFLNPAAALAGYFAGGTTMFALWPLMIFVVAPAVGGVLGFGLSDLLSKYEK